MKSLTLLLSFLLLASCAAMAQQTNAEDICAEGGKMETELLAKYKEMLDSDEHKEYVHKVNEFYEKSQYWQHNRQQIKNGNAEEITKWILKNPEKTKFGSYEMAEIEVANFNRMNKERVERNDVLNGYVNQCARQCFEVFRRVTMKLVKEYGTSFRP